MLRFFRPWRGTRMVWVDSICINQDDIQEREAQVAKMAHIYSECRQAVVYLGDDVVKATAPGQYPPRKRLEDSIGTLPASHAALVDEAKGMVDIDRLLNRRYFSRVWIIQELILPRQVAIPVGTMELYADKDTGPSLRSRPGMIAAAPWLTAVGQRQIATEQQGSIYSILLTTSKSHATDPRDKVFGAHALINNDVDDREALRPNYSLSCLHVFFGAFSHCLIKLKRTELLCNAAGASARTGYPSWTPDWTSPGATQHWFLKRPLIWETDRERPWDPQSRKERWTGERFSFPKEWWTGESFCKWWAMGDGRPNSQPDSVTMHVSTESRRWRTDSELYRDEKILSYDWSRGIPLELFTTEAELRYAELRQGSQWDHAPAVDATNGSLSIRLIHILRFETVPEKAGSALRARIFKVSSPATGAEMYLTTDLNFSLNRHVVAGRDHLFLLDRGASSPPLYLVMRKCQGGPWQFKLLGCCFHLCFHASPGTWTRRSVKVRYNRYDSDRDEIVIEDQVPRQDDHLFLADLQRPLTDTIASVRASVEDILQNDAEDSSRLLCIGERANAMALLPVFQGLLNERKGASPGLLESYAAYVGEKHQTTVHGEHLELVIQPEDWETTYTPELASLFKEWKYDAAASDSEWSSSRKVRYSLFRSKKPIRIRTAKSDLEKAVSDSKVYTELSRLSRAPSIGTGTTEVSMLDRAGWREDAGRLADPAWPKSIVEGFKIDGGTYNVTIL
ncbi:heterokaryon incompatibility protein-domain-containing protein [Podospora conica]|nr:heterokaryon incompatibility protein-domain-containing protein [Schizothecium conicum]